MKLARALWPLALLSIQGCEDSVSGFLSCGIEVCTARQECVSSAAGPTCACAEGFVEPACSECDSGYELVGNRCELIPIDCAVEPEVCGLHGACVDAAGSDECACEALYEGRLCDRCQSGYQDKDADGVCRPTCAEAKLDCEAPSRCSDEGGTAVCECPIGYTGDDCSRCALGYRDSGTACVPTCAATSIGCSSNQICVDSPTGARCECAEGYGGFDCESCAEGYLQDPTTGTCLPSCEASTASCGPHGTCDDSVGFARCVCELGYAGAGCKDCAPAFEEDSDEETCERNPTASESLVMTGAFEGRSVLATLDPTSGSALPLVELDVSGVSSGAEAQTLFVNDSGLVSTYSLATGNTEDAVKGSGAVGPLTWDAATERLYALGGSPDFPLLSIDPATKTVVELFDTELAGAADLAFDSANQRVLVLRDSLFAVSLADGAVSELSALPPATVGIEVSELGELIALSATDAEEAASRVQACRATARSLDLPGYASATGRFVAPDSDEDSVSLASATADQLEVLSYLGRGGAAPRTLEISADNPDAFLCLALEEGTLVRVTAEARFRALVIYAADAPVELELEEGFTDAGAPKIFLGGYAPDFTYPDRDDIVAYTPQEWVALGLAVDQRYHRPGPGVLHTLDASFAVGSSVTLSGSVVPAGPLSGWEPVAP
jgi:hypothetical protein